MIDGSQQFLKILRKIFFLLILLTPFLVLFMAIVSPILWITNLFGGVSNEAGQVEDFRSIVDRWQSFHHISFNQEDLTACTMNEEYSSDPQQCLYLFNNEGILEETLLDLSPADYYAQFKSVEEFTGKIPDAAFEDLWIPTLYVIDYYDHIYEEDPQTHEVIQDEWVFAYTKEEVYKDFCEAQEPAERCRIIREGFFTYPYIKPAQNSLKSRYGYALSGEDFLDGTLIFHSGQIYEGRSEIVSMSTGTVVEVTDQEILIEYNHNFSFAARYKNLDQVLVSAGQEVEWNEAIGSGTNVNIETYLLEESLYFNPSILIGDYSSIQDQILDMEDPVIVEMMEHFSFALPFNNYRITQEFGVMNIDGQLHTGIDLQPTPREEAEGHPIAAGVSGEVVQQGYDSISGNYITIEDAASGIQVKYNHMQTSAYFSLGDWVDQGECIGLVGHTGLTTGPHVHIGIKVNGNWVNPKLFIPF